MFKEKFTKWKETFFSTEGNNKKKIENLIVFLILLVIVIIAINYIWKDDKKESKNIENKDKYKQLATEVENSNNINTNEYNLEENLKNILSKIAGARKSRNITKLFRK